MALVKTVVSVSGASLFRGPHLDQTNRIDEGFTFRGIGFHVPSHVSPCRGHDRSEVESLKNVFRVPMYGNRAPRYVYKCLGHTGNGSSWGSTIHIVAPVTPSGTYDVWTHTSQR
jgi:hypothetical protein